MIAFTKDQVIYRGEVAYRVVRPLSLDEVQLENLVTGELANHKSFNLLNEFVAGELCTLPQRKHALATASGPKRKPARMDHMSDVAKTETRRRIDYLVRLNNKNAFAASRKELRRLIAEVAAERKEERPPHESTVYRWRRRYLRAQRDVRALFCKFGDQGGKGLGRLDPEVEGVIHAKIEEIFLAKRRSSAEEVHNAVFLEISRLNTPRVEEDWLKVPGLRTIQRRLSKLYAFELAVARYDRREAERRFAHHLGARQVFRILEIVEIDHSPVDLMVTDENRIVIGRPIITVLLDRLSRCVVGYVLSLAGHGVPTVFEAVRHALLPKTYLKERYADLHLEWNCYGWPEKVLMDNGPEFHADAISDALTNIGVITEFAKSRDPNDKPHVERFLKTFNYSFIHRLPGTTLAKVHERIGYKAEEEAAITMDELDRMIHVWICSVYHVRPHGGLDDRTPIDVWNESARDFPPQLKANKEDLDIEFSEIAESALQHYGIDLNTWVYVSTRLLTLRRMLPQRTKVNVKWPRNDVGHIFVWDPLEEEYFKVDNKEEEYAGLTLEQAQAAKKVKAAGDPSYKQTRAQAEEIVADMVSEAKKAKKLKTRRQGARLGNTTSKDSREAPRQPKPRPVAAAPTPAHPPAEIKTLSVEVLDFTRES